MVDHESIRDQLVSLALGALDEPQRSEVNAHVAGCDRCRAEFEQLSSAWPCLAASESFGR
jgi:anti-sigma factor RsiW